MEQLQTFWSTYNTLIFTVGVHAMLALSIYLTLSCGLLSLGNAAFMGIGAYTAALVTLKLALPFPVALACGGVLPGVVALVIGVPTLRLSGVYLAMATLGFGEVVRVVLLNMEITGGSMGLNGIPLLTRGWHIVLALGVLVYFFERLRRSKVGRCFEAIREDETAARTMGINTTRYKLLAFVLGAVIAGVAGGLNAHFTFFLSPREYGFDPAVDILTGAVLGGIGSYLGPMLGGAILAVLPELLRFLKDYRLAVNGVILVLVVIYLPNGVWDRRLFARLRRRPGPTPEGEG
ncbi:MAG: branched-chain amino acid ABC transporter permease [Deltaproteobacteria bacterium]|nr:branched-chain amino acid ABC transporter permease [Deltaproteobacteria bacterium]